MDRKENRQCSNEDNAQHTGGHHRNDWWDIRQCPTRTRGSVTPDVYWGCLRHRSDLEERPRGPPDAKPLGNSCIDYRTVRISKEKDERRTIVGRAANPHCVENWEEDFDIPNSLELDDGILSNPLPMARAKSGGEEKSNQVVSFSVDDPFTNFSDEEDRVKSDKVEPEPPAAADESDDSDWDAQVLYNTLLPPDLPSLIHLSLIHPFNTPFLARSYPLFMSTFLLQA
eukprot:1339525-Amorphochlora_amoeboformis.AAC.2